MTSKEALKRLKQETSPATYMNDFDKDECIEIIKQDLKRLEKLEEENEKLKVENDELLDNKLELVIKNKQQDMFIEKLIQECDKLKKGIGLLTYKPIDILHIKISKSVEEYNKLNSECYNFTQEEYEYYELLQEEFDLLKEYLDDK